MNAVALQMLIGDKAKYCGLIFAIAFSSFLVAYQVSAFTGLMNRTTSQIRDIRDARIWVMDAQTQYADEVKALPDQDLYRIRGVEGVDWAVPLYKGVSRAKVDDGRFRSVILIGVDDATLVGAPRDLALGDLSRLRDPGTIAIDQVGFRFFFPDKPLQLDRTLTMNDHLVRIVAIVNSSAPFQNLPVVYTRYSQAITYVGRERNLMSFVLAKGRDGVPEADLCARIQSATQLKAMTATAFNWQNIRYQAKHSGIPVNYGIVVTVALVVGTVVAGQTFYLFIYESLRQFGTLKAIGVTGLRIVGMILLQVFVVGSIGYCFGIAMTAALLTAVRGNLQLRGFWLPWEVMAGTAIVELVIIALASLMSIRRVLVLEPVEVFRG